MGPGFRRGRRRGLVLGAAVGAAAANRNNKSKTDNSQPADTQDSDQQIEELKKLGELKDQGILTQEEFDAKKKQILEL